MRSNTKDVLFLGWFGPIGAAALYYAAFSLRETGIEEVWVVGSLVICASVVVHGVTVAHQTLREVAPHAVSEASKFIEHLFYDIRE